MKNYILYKNVYIIKNIFQWKISTASIKYSTTAIISSQNLILLNFKIVEWDNHSQTIRKYSALTHN